jgi:hypothetical protein
VAVASESQIQSALAVKTLAKMAGKRTAIGRKARKASGQAVRRA